MKSAGATGAYHREGRLLVSHRATDVVQTINRRIADLSRLARNTNRDATPAPKVTDVVSVRDFEARCCHELHMYRLDYRPRNTPSVGTVVAFSDPCYAAWSTEKLKLGTPAHYRDEKNHKPGIGDHRDGTLAKDATAWGFGISPSVTMTSAKITFASQGEPWVYCAAHYRTSAELRRLKKHFADGYGYQAATRIIDPDAFALWLGIEFALALDKKADVKLDVWDELGYARSNVTDLWGGPRPIDTLVHVYHGPVHYTDLSGRIERREQAFDPLAGPKAWFTKKTALKSQSEYRFAVTTLGSPVEPEHYIAVSPELRALTAEV